MSKLFRITEADVLVLEEMREASIIALEIKSERQLIRELEHQKAEIEYNELLKYLEPELLEQAVESRSFYESTENAVEKLKKTFRLFVNNQDVLAKMKEIDKEIEEKSKYIEELCEVQKNITAFLEVMKETRNE